jgi:prevent-host-death family protein
LSYWLDRAADGEEVIVTERGKPRARITAVDGKTTLQRLIEQGIVTPASKPKRPIDFRGLPRLRGRPNLSDIVIEQRRARDY